MPTCNIVGSSDETWRSLGLNHESFEVFCSWNGETNSTGRVTT